MLREAYERAVGLGASQLFATRWRPAAVTGALVLVWLAGNSVVGIQHRALGQPTAADVNADSCIVEMTGDVNQSGSINSADIIYLVNVAFLSGPSPEPCWGAGDVNCDGVINSPDIVYLVRYVFKSGSEPCDICTSEFAQGSGCIE